MSGIQEKRIVLIARRMVASNRVWNVDFDRIRDNQGREIQDYVVLSPKGGGRADLLTGVCVVPVVDGEVMMMRVYRHVLDRELWEIPRGFIDPGEDPAQAALRELEEETGLLCDSGAMESLGHVFPEASTIRGGGALFVAKDCRPGGRARSDEPGLGAPRRIPQAEVFAMLDRFEIEESNTAVALYRYRAWVEFG